MKGETTIIIILIMLTITLLIVAEHQTGELKDARHERDSIVKDCRSTEEQLLQCADCCNQMNIRMSDWYVRKDSIIYDFYLRSMKQ